MPGMLEDSAHGARIHDVTAQIVASVDSREDQIKIPSQLIQRIADAIGRGGIHRVGGEIGGDLHLFDLLGMHKVDGVAFAALLHLGGNGDDLAVFFCPADEVGKGRSEDAVVVGDEYFHSQPSLFALYSPSRRSASAIRRFISRRLFMVAPAAQA